MNMRFKPCPECEGQGTRTYERACYASASTPYGDYEEYEDDCDNCGGSGQIEADEDEEEELDEDERGDWLMHKRQDEEMDRGQ